jgi:Cu/Ag efflux protein CusF
MTGPSRTVVTFRFLVGLFVALVLLGLPCRTTIKAQEEHKPHVPVLDKITSGGPTQQAFSGIVKSVDLESEVLNVDNVNGKSTEIFPIRKKVRVVTADGDKLKLAKLKPGTNVLIYYEQKGDRRTVTGIVVLAGGPVKKKTPPS